MKPCRNDLQTRVNTASTIIFLSDAGYGSTSPYPGTGPAQPLVTTRRQRVCTRPRKARAEEAWKGAETEIQEGMVYRFIAVEPSEEVRLETMKLLKHIVVKILDSPIRHIRPYFTDTILLVAVGICDPYPEMKLESYDLICELAKKVPPGTKHFAEGVIKLIMPALGHRHAKIRLAALHTIDRLIQCPDEMKRKGAGTGAFTALIGHRDANVLPIASFYHGEARVNYFAKIVVDHSIPLRANLQSASACGCMICRTVMITLAEYCHICCPA